MQRLSHELKERRIWRALVAYPGVAFVLLEAIEFFIDNYGIDGRLLTVGLIAAVGLFPVALIWNWRHGEKGRQDVSRSEIGGYLLFGLATLSVVGWYWQKTPADGLPVSTMNPVASVVVLPFESVGGEKLGFLTEGIPENLINWLAGVSGVRVVSKSAAFRYAGDIYANEELRETFGVDSAIRGEIEVQDQQLIVSVSFDRLGDNSRIWGERMVRPLNEVLFLERSLVSAIKSSLGVRIGEGQGRAAASGSTDSPEAYRHYLRGHHLIQSTDLATIELGVDELRQAIRVDPQFGLPYADIADALSQIIFYGNFDDQALMGEARNAAFSAVALSPDLPEAHVALATMHQYLTFDWPAVELAYETAIALSPQNPAPYHRYSDFLWVTLRFEKARELAARAIEIDPLDSSSMHAVGVVELFSGQFEAAAAAFGDWNRFHPQSRWSYVKHAIALALSDRCPESADQLEKVEQLAGGTMSLLMHSWVGWSHKVCGREDLFREKASQLERAKDQNPDKVFPELVWYYVYQDQPDLAIDVMREMVDTRHPASLFLQVYGLDIMGGRMFLDNPEFSQLIADLEFPPVDPG